MKRFVITIPLVCITFTAFTQDTTVTAIISKTRNTYKSLNTYFDSGKVVLSIYNVPHPFSTAKLFKTSYTNKGLFNFEYYEVGKSNSLYVVNRSEDKVQSWWGVTNKTDTANSLDKPLSAAAGVSSLTSVMIPKLLFANSKISAGDIFESMITPQYAGKEVVNGKLCYRITGKNDLNNETEIWIGEKDFLIYKVIDDKRVKDFNVKSVFQFVPYHPALVEEKLFAFKPNRQIEL